MERLLNWLSPILSYQTASCRRERERGRADSVMTDVLEEFFGLLCCRLSEGRMN